MKNKLSEIADAVRMEPQLVVTDDWELLLQAELGQSYSFQRGVLTKVAQSQRNLVLLRLFHRQREGVAWTTDSSPSGLRRLVQESFLSAESTDVDLWARFPIWRGLPTQPLVESAPGGAVPSSLSQFPDEIQEELRRGQLLVRKKEKQAPYFEFSTHRLSLQTPELRERRHFRRWPSDIASVIKRFANESEMLGPETPLATVPVEPIAAVFSPRVVAEMLRQTRAWFAADAIYSGQSPLCLKRGEKAFSPSISIADVGEYPNSGSSRPWDSEGVAAQETWLVEKGVVEGYLFNSRFAMRENRLSTGNSLFDWTEGRLQIAPSTLVIRPGKGVLGDWLGASHCFLACRVDEITGEGEQLQMTLSGGIFENGELLGKCVGLRTRLGLGSLWQSVTSTSSDLQLFDGCAAPSIFFQKMPLKE